jgi:gamma-glutamylcyclotransferase (GGCT)/AIG2-like uncharacterized protein YtfP
MPPAALFVYGTLMPEFSRWPLLAPFTTGEPSSDHVPGQLYDTGRGYPAACFGPGRATAPGLVVPLRAGDLDEALRAMDEVEGVAAGLFHRVEVRTVLGTLAWSYEWAGSREGLVPITRWT